MRTIFLTLSILSLAGTSFAGQWSHNYRQAKRSNKGGSSAKAAPGKAAAGNAGAPGKADSGFSRDFQQNLWAGEGQRTIGRAPVSPVRGLDDDAPPAPGYLQEGALIRTGGLGYKYGDAGPGGFQAQGGTAIVLEDNRAVTQTGAHKGVVVGPKDTPPVAGGASGANAVTTGEPTKP